MTPETWYTVREISERLKVHEQTIREWLRKGELRGRNLGGRAGWRVREADLEEFMNREDIADE